MKSERFEGVYWKLWWKNTSVFLFDETLRNIEGLDDRIEEYQIFRLKGHKEPGFEEI